MEHSAERRGNDNVSETIKNTGSTKWKNKIKRLLTSNQDNNATSHGNAGLACFVISTTGGALHSHAGYAQASNRYNNTHNHEGAGCLEGTWVKRQDGVKSSVIVTDK